MRCCVPGSMTPNSQSKLHILLTTSRDPSRRTRTFIKDLALTLPRATRVARGTRNIYELATAALDARAALLMVVSTRKGNPGTINFFRVTEQTYFQLPLELLLQSVKLRYKSTRQKIPRPDKLFIRPIEPLSPRTQRLCEELSAIFMISFIDDSQTVGKTSTVMQIEETKNIIYLTFFHGAHAKEVGPQLRIGKVKFLERTPM